MKEQKAINLVQPNKVTNARQDYNETQENILTLMIDAIQKHMSNETPIQTDLFGEPLIIIDTKEIGSNNKRHIANSAEKMTSKMFQFEWVRPTDNKTIKTTGVLVTTVHEIKGTSKIELSINKWAIPYLLYWGEGVGGTIYNKRIAITIKGEYTKRLYKLCKRWENQGGFTMSIEEFRKMMYLENKYPKLKDLKKRVLDSSILRMKEYADVYFKYSTDNIGGSRAQNQLYFTIFGNNKRKSKVEKTDMYVLVYNMLCLPFPNIKSSKAQEITDKLAENPQQLDEIYRRLKRLKNELDIGEKNIKDVIKLVRYILKNDYGFN